MSYEKLRLYKTAFSRTYDSYVAILRVYLDEVGEPVIVARPASTDQEIRFRECELSEFCL